MILFFKTFALIRLIWPWLWQAPLGPAVIKRLMTGGTCWVTFTWLCTTWVQWQHTHRISCALTIACAHKHTPYFESVCTNKDALRRLVYIPHTPLHPLPDWVFAQLLSTGMGGMGTTETTWVSGGPLHAHSPWQPDPNTPKHSHHCGCLTRSHRVSLVKNELASLC